MEKRQKLQRKRYLKIFIDRIRLILSHKGDGKI